jgi:hypothetical protein
MTIVDQVRQPHFIKDYVRDRLINHEDEFVRNGGQGTWWEGISTGLSGPQMNPQISKSGNKIKAPTPQSYKQPTSILLSTQTCTIIRYIHNGAFRK